MAKDAKKTSAFGIDPTSFDESRRRTGSEHVDTHTHDDADVYVDRPIKNKRIQILTYSNLVRRIDARAKREGMSRAEFFEKVMTEYLDRE